MAVDDALVFCTEALTEGEVREIGAAMSAVWPNWTTVAFGHLGPDQTLVH